MPSEIRVGWEADPPILPQPFSYSNGSEPCNEPYVVDGVEVGYCVAVNKMTRKGIKPHKGKHRIEWE